MPRITTKQYIAARTWLTGIWIDKPSAWSRISQEDQRLLHDYFEPSIPHSQEQILEHRRRVTLEQPSLPQQAGRALKRFRQVMAGELKLVPRMAITPAVGRRKARAISVRSVLKPQPDAKRFARALLSLTPEQLAKIKRGESLRDDEAA